MNNFDLKVGFDCNHNCVHCVVSESAKYGSLSYDQIRRVTNDIPKEDSVTLTGGEPTIRPDFLSIVDLFKRHSHINIQTNGTGITEEVCQKLKRYPVHVLLTIHSVDKETYDKTARCPDSSYDKAIEAAKYLTRHNINFTWQIVVHTLNKDTVFDSFLFAKSINNKILLKLTYPDPAGNADDKALLCSYAELRPVLERVIDEFKTSMSFEGFPLCIVKNHAKYFNEARLKKESYGLNFENDATVCKYNMKNRYAYVDACDVCSVKNRCRGIYKKYVEYFGCKEFEPVESNFTTEYKFQNFFLWVL
jgi:MoaA/NifB/PqqE/SkfB family radical SAM enzyme